MPNWKSKKDGTHFRTDKVKRDNGNPDVHVEVDVNDLESFADEKKNDLENNEFEIDSVMLEDYGFGLEEGKDYEITPYGSVDYIGGFGKVLETLGGKELTEKQVIELAKKIDGELIGGDESDYNFWTNSKENANTYNYSSAIGHDLNYGFIKDEDDEKTYIVFAEHVSGDVRHNYLMDRVFDISKIDNGATGEPDGDISVLLDPHVRTSIKYNGERYDVNSDGGMSGNEWSTEFGDYLDRNEVDKLFKDAKTSFGDAFENFIKSRK